MPSAGSPTPPQRRRRPDLGREVVRTDHLRGPHRGESGPGRGKSAPGPREVEPRTAGSQLPPSIVRAPRADVFRPRLRSFALTAAARRQVLPRPSTGLGNDSPMTPQSRTAIQKNSYDSVIITWVRSPGRPGPVLLGLLGDPVTPVTEHGA